MKLKIQLLLNSRLKEKRTMSKLPKIALGAWAWSNDGTFGGIGV